MTKYAVGDFVEVQGVVWQPVLDPPAYMIWSVGPTLIEGVIIDRGALTPRSCRLGTLMWTPDEYTETTHIRVTAEDLPDAAIVHLAKMALTGEGGLKGELGS